MSDDEVVMYPRGTCCYRSLANLATSMGQWAHELFGCFDDISVCLFTWLLPCWYQGELEINRADQGFFHWKLFFDAISCDYAYL